MTPKRNCDPLLRQAAQYRVDEISYVDDGSGVESIVLPFNPNRILIRLQTDFPGFKRFFFKTAGGVYINLAEQTTSIGLCYTLALHYTLPTLEVVCTNVNVGVTLTGIALVKQ